MLFSMKNAGCFAPAARAASKVRAACPVRIPSGVASCRPPYTGEKHPSGDMRRAAARAVNGPEATVPGPSRGHLVGTQAAVLAGFPIRTWFTAQGGHLRGLSGLQLAAHRSATCARLACALNAALAGIVPRCGRHDASTEAVCRAQGYHLGSQPIVGRWPLLPAPKLMKVPSLSVSSRTLDIDLIDKPYQIPVTGR